jgi:hypothetical protein
MKLDKLEVARRQLETGIRLMFFSDDPVSAHTLLFASSEVLRDLCKFRGITSEFDDAEDLWIKPEYRKDYDRHVRHRAVFIKHADRDPTAEIDEFDHRVNHVLALASIFRFNALTGRSTPSMTVFTMWFGASRPYILKKVAEPTKLLIDVMSGLDDEVAVAFGRVMWAATLKEQGVFEIELERFRQLAPEAYSRFVTGAGVRAAVLNPPSLGQYL